MKRSLFSLYALCVGFCVNITLQETVSVDDPIVQTLARQGKYTLEGGAKIMDIKFATRKPVPAGWKYMIIMDVTIYGSDSTKECIVVGVYDITTGEIWLSNPDPLNPVPCGEFKR